MTPGPVVHALVVFLAGGVAGGINSVAGGGTLLAFPTLIWLGLPSVSANMTSTIALWPGSLGGVWGFRRELATVDRRVYALAVPSVGGGILGALLLRVTPTDVFDWMLPFLILFATLLLMAQDAVQRRFDLTALHHARSHWLSWTMLFQFGVAVYGGYFGAGIGILMLAALSLMGHTDIHQMNGIKNLFAVCINGVAAFYFAVTGDIYWTDAAIMAAGSIAGGVGGAGLFRRLGRQAVRRFVIAIGFLMALSTLLRQWP
jgi:uncharacterized membrane protein YfcA